MKGNQCLTDSNIIVCIKHDGNLGVIEMSLRHMPTSITTKKTGTSRYQLKKELMIELEIKVREAEDV